MNTSDLIQARHLSRRAKIYIRQSSPNQVLTNLESQRMQYALRDRAVALGWHESEIDVIDADLGRSGASIEGREGFKQLVADIALGEAGILLAFDATRLARNCSNWYQLLDLCGHTECLIGDRDGVYDPSSINGRLLLGLKGQISELELHTIRARLTAGIFSKAQRGELELTLPTGLVRLDSGIVVRHPSLEVQQRIELIFATLLERKSIAQTVRWLNENNLTLPRRDRYGDIRWKRATVASVSSIVKNPAYAGAAAYGRTRWKKSEHTGKMQGATLPPDQWRYCVRGKFPAYISWDVFEKIQAMLRDNYSEYTRNKTRGVPREGKALLHGLLYCGECGHKLCVKYKGGTQYLCNQRLQQTGGSPCQRIPADPIDDQVVQWFFGVLSHSEIDVANEALAATDRDFEQVLVARRKQVERLRYESQLAERQFMKSDPDNRLVTGELERRWEASLRELKTMEEALAQDECKAPVFTIPADMIDILKDVGRQLPVLWNESGLLSSAQKKSLLRSMIDKVVIHRAAHDQVQTRVVWRGGATTSTLVRVTVGKFAWLSSSNEMIDIIETMTHAGHTDAAIAAHLTKLGHRSPRSESVLESTVQGVRLSRNILRKQYQSHPRHKAGYLTIPMLAKKLGVSSTWIHDRIKHGTITPVKDPELKCYLFPDTEQTLAEFRAVMAAFEQKMAHRRGHHRD
jgi:DNA invertase Pin-like site-specific DNA recombinase